MARGRKSSVRYWASRGGYCCEIAGKQVVLAEGPDDQSSDGPVYNAAVRRHAELVCGTPVGAGGAGPTLREVADKYIGWLADNRAADTAKIVRERMDVVCAEFGAWPVSRLTSYALETWVAKQKRERGWSGGGVRLIFGYLRACLKWAADKLGVPYPLGKLEMPQVKSRGKECVLTPEQIERVIAACLRRQVRDYVTVLARSGARPGEIRKAEAKHFDARLGALVLTTHKNSRKTDKPRTIYLAGDALEIVRRLCVQHPTGPLFRSSHPRRTGDGVGQRLGFKAQNAQKLFSKLSKKTGIPGLVAYSMRHSFAVRWLESGKPAIVLAEILGTSLEMIEKHYGHVADQTAYLRRLIEDMAAGR